MNSYLVYINGNLIDLYPDTNVAISVKNGKVSELNIRSVSHSTTLKVPASENNNLLLGNSNLVTSGSNKPYESNTVKVVMNGIEFPDGIAIVNQVNKSYEIDIYLDFFEFITSLGTSTLRDLDFGGGTITYNNAYISSRRNATSSIVTPFINYGQLGTDSNFQPTEIAFAIGFVYPPSIYYKDVLDAIFENAGIEKEGSVFTDDFYDKTILPFGYETFTASFLIQEILPAITQKNFLKDFCIRFAVYFYATGSTITCKQISELIDNKEDALDLTSFRDGDREIIKFIFDLGQINNFTYPSADSFFQPVNAEGSFTIPNVNLEETNDIYDSIFAGSAQQDTTIGLDSIRTMYIPYWTSLAAPVTYTFDNTPSARIGLVRAKDTPEPAVSYNGTPQTDYLVGHFEAGGGATHTQNWEYILDRYYQTYIDSVQKLKIVERFYYLTEVDVIKLMKSNVIFDSDCYFIVLEVINFIPGKLTKLELMRVF